MTMIRHKTIKPYTNPITSGYNRNEDFVYSVVCLNQTTTDVTIVMRDNLPITYNRISSTGASCNQVFTIRKIYDFRSNQCIQETINNLYVLIGNDEKDQLISDDLYFIYQELLRLLKHNQYTKVASIVIDRSLSLKEIVELDHCYLSDLDITLYHGRYSPNMLHPYSLKAKTLEVFGEIQSVKLTSGMLMEIVTDENTLTTRYVSMCGQIMRVPNSIDDERPAGLYITRIENNHSTTEFCELNEMQDKYNVYPTQEEALTAGQPDVIYKNKLKEMEQELEITKRQSQKESVELKMRYERDQFNLEIQRDKDKTEHEKTLNRLRQEHEEFMSELKRTNAKQKQDMDEKLHKLEEERQKTKDHYERRSYERKDNSEYLKTIGIIVAGVLSLIAIAKKS